jgi:hypothetical protein
MNYTINDLIQKIENLPDHGKTDPRTGLLELRQHCASALHAMSQMEDLSNEQRAIQSTIWMVDSIISSEAGFDRWLLFVLRSKKTACANLLRKYLLRDETARIAA